jgi:hypothetical protein
MPTNKLVITKPDKYITIVNRYFPIVIFIIKITSLNDPPIILDKEVNNIIRPTFLVIAGNSACHPADP